MRSVALGTLLFTSLASGQTNLTFRDGRAGQVPPGWTVADAAHRGFTASWRNADCQGVASCALLVSPPDTPDDMAGGLTQSFPAEPFRGGRVRLRAWIRLEKSGPATHAELLLDAERPNHQPGFTARMPNVPITIEGWGQYEIQGDMAPDADVVSIGVSLYGSGRTWLGAVEFAPVTSQVNGPAVDTARQAIAGQYGRMDTAFVHGNVHEMSAVLLPGAQMGVGVIREPLLPAIEAEIAKGEKLTARTEITSLRLDGDEAIVMVRRTAIDPKSDGSRSVVTSHRDTWLQMPDGWRWRESIEVSYHWVIPATPEVDAKPVIAELKAKAVAADGTADLNAFGEAVGNARIVALGEPAHGTREFSQLKTKLVEYLVAKKGFTVLIGFPEEAQALADRLHVEFASAKVDTPANWAAMAARNPRAKVVLWTDNATARDSALRQKFGRRMYAVGFTFRRGEVRAVGVEKGESKGLAVYTAPPSPEGSGDGVLSGAGLPQFFLNFSKAAPGGPLAKWIAGLHLFHDLGAYWILDDPDAGLQPEQLSTSYDGLYYVDEVHSGG